MGPNTYRCLWDSRGLKERWDLDKIHLNSHKIFNGAGTRSQVYFTGVELGANSAY